MFYKNVGMDVLLNRLRPLFTKLLTPGLTHELCNSQDDWLDCLILANHWIYYIIRRLTRQLRVWWIRPYVYYTQFLSFSELYRSRHQTLHRARLNNNSFLSFIHFYISHFKILSNVISINSSLKLVTKHHFVSKIFFEWFVEN